MLIALFSALSGTNIIPNFALMLQMYDVIIIGAGPCGLSCSIQTQKNNLKYLVIEKVSITDSIRRFPVNMTFYSTSENLEIGRIPFTSLNFRPTRVEALEYYRKVYEHFHLNVLLHTEVLTIKKQADHFEVTVKNGSVHNASKIVIATGYYDIPRHLNIDGENLPHVLHYYDEPFKYAYTNVIIVGGANSSADTALDLFRHGAQVTLIHRQKHLYPNIKYWIKPDIENRIKEGSIKAHFNAEIASISKKSVRVYDKDKSKTFELPADFVFLLTGYHPNTRLMEELGVHIALTTKVPDIDPDTFETNVDGVYVAGSIVGGEEAKKIFIENGRHHGQAIIQDILKKNKS